MADSPKVLIIPGWNNSGPAHWQTLWERQNPACRRVHQRDWDRPDRLEWVQGIQDAVAEEDALVVLVAHSLGCLAVMHWAEEFPKEARKVAGALLVAPPDLDSMPEAKSQLITFTPAPRRALPFPSILVGSENDPYAHIDVLKRWSAELGSEFVNMGAAGHLNADSGFGPWPEGEKLLERLTSESLQSQPSA